VNQLPLGEPRNADVLVELNNCRAEDLHIDAERLEASLALRARLANLLQVVAGVDVESAGVGIDLKGVEADAYLRVRLENLHGILARTLTTLDPNGRPFQRAERRPSRPVAQTGD
jgi:hypothetical protein